MALGVCSDETSMSCDNQDDSFSDLIHFVDVASSRIRQALDRPRTCRRKVNHRKYLAKIFSASDVTGSTSTRNDHFTEQLRGHNESPSKPSTIQLGHQSKRKSSHGVRRCLKARKTQSVSEVGERSRSSDAVSRQRSSHVGTQRLVIFTEETQNSAVARYDKLLETELPRYRRSAMALSSYYHEPVATLSVGQPDLATSAVNSEPHHSSCVFSHPPSDSLPQQSPQLSSPELADGNSLYQTCFRKPSCYPATWMQPVHTENCAEYLSSSRYLCANNQQFVVSGAYQQETSTVCSDNDECLKDVSSPPWTYDHQSNNNQHHYGWTSPPVISPCALSLSTGDSNIHDVTNSLQHQQSTFSRLPYSPPTALSHIRTPVDRRPDHWTVTPMRSQDNVCADASPLHFDDSGLGSISFGSTSDTNLSSSTDSSFLWPSNYAFFSSKPSETCCGDSDVVPTIF